MSKDKKKDKKKKKDDERSLMIVGDDGEKVVMLTAEDCIDIVAQFYTIAWNKMVENLKKEDVK